MQPEQLSLSSPTPGSLSMHSESPTSSIPFTLLAPAAPSQRLHRATFEPPVRSMRDQRRDRTKSSNQGSTTTPTTHFVGFVVTTRSPVVLGSCSDMRTRLGSCSDLRTRLAKLIHTNSFCSLCSG
ncbi:hypothetical protein LINPERHAP1_LOCUS31246 [Linum perenne]